jgi:hypothetical protein
MVRVIRVLTAIIAATTIIFAAPPVFAVDDACNGNVFKVNCNSGEGGSNNGGGLFEVLNIFVNVLTVGVVIAATGGVIFAALRYTQARDNAESMAGAKKMIINIIIGLIVWAIFWVALQWLLPGGLFDGAP